MNATATITSQDGSRRSIDTTTTAEALAIGLGQVPARVERSAFMAVRLSGAHLVLTSGAVRFYAKSPETNLVGQLRATQVTGTVTYDENSTVVEHKLVEIDGTLDLRLSNRPRGGIPSRSGGQDPVDVDVSGMASRVVVGTRILLPPSMSTTLPLASGGLIAVIVGAYFLLRPAILTFYCRIAPNRISEHPHRRLILDFVHTNPGASTTDLSRVCGVSRASARHHLRLLIANKNIVAVPKERGELYYPVDAASKLGVVAGFDGAARQVIELLRATPTPLTSREISARVAVSRRLVTYHLNRLEGRGVVRHQGRLPAVYSLCTAEQ
jgi:DNA-binding transcriptional ArsR family regulator